MATKAAHKRLMKEYAAIQTNPPPYIIAKPTEKNILEWHYVITGPRDSVYANGEYHGKLVFPPEYPFKPPAIQMITPNGRFKTQTRLCLSMSDFHPESWNPSWAVASILTGLLSFMLEDTATTGSISSTTDSDKRILARQSRRWNRQNNSKFAEVFPDLFRQPIDDTTSDITSTANSSVELAQKGSNYDNNSSNQSSSNVEANPPNSSSDSSREPSDLIMSELRGLFSSGTIRMLVGGLVIYAVYYIWALRSRHHS